MQAAAWVLQKGDHVFVFAQSGFRGVVADHDSFSEKFAFPPARANLARAVRQALKSSKHFDPNKMGWDAIDEFMDELAPLRHEEFVNQALAATGIKTKNAFYKGCKACSIDQIDDQLTIKPTMDGKGGWGKHQPADDQYRYCAVDASDEELQQAVLEALEISR